MTSTPASDDSDQDIADQALDWIGVLSAGDVTDADIALLTKWLAQSERHARAFAHERATWEAIEGNVSLRT